MHRRSWSRKRAAPLAALVGALCFALLSMGAGRPLPVAAQSSDRLVLAFYYNWFDENSWASNKVPDVPATTYVSRDRGAMGRQIDQAKSAGIDALVVNWWGPNGNNQTETNLKAMLDEAQARGFRLAVDVDLASSPYLQSAGGVQAALAALLGTHAKHPAFLRSGGKPVIFFYNSAARFGVGTWSAIRAAVDPNHNSLWIEEGTDVSPLTVFDGHHLYSVTWANRTPMAATANKFASWVRQKAAALGTAKIYVATVMPGYDDRKTGRGAAFVVGREGGAYYEQSWQAAIGSAPDWIVINSFNEWPEGTYIEPSKGAGNLYLDLTAKWAAAFRSSSPAAAAPAPTAQAATVAAATDAPAATQSPAGTPAPTLAPTLPPTPAPTRTPAPTPERPVRLGGDGPLVL